MTQRIVTAQSLPPAAAANVSHPVTASSELAPGIPFPPYGTIWVLDPAEPKAKLVRIFMTSAVPNKHAVENMARDELLVVKEVSTLDLLGAASKLRIASHTPAIYVRNSESPEEEARAAVSAKGAQFHYVLLRMRALEGRRELCSFSHWKFGGKRTRHEEDIQAATDEITGGQWLKITPKQPLADGEYAVVRMPDDKTQAATQAYDFGVGPLPANP